MVRLILGWWLVFGGSFWLDWVVRTTFSVESWNESIGLAGFFPWQGVGQWGSFLLLVLILLSFGISSWWLMQRPEPWRTSGFWLQAGWLAGAVANLLDRWRFGAVRDVWLIPGVSLAINLADIIITTAMIGTLLWIWTWERAPRRQ